MGTPTSPKLLLDANVFRDLANGAIPQFEERLRRVAAFRSPPLLWICPITFDEIVSHIPTITLADVHSALAYYFDHVQEIQEDIRADREYADEFFRSNPSLLDAKLKPERLQEAS